MRALMTRTRTAASSRALYFAATSGVLALALLVTGLTSTSQADPPMGIVNFQGVDLGYYNLYSFAGTITNAQSPASVMVTIYINGYYVGTTNPDASGHFEVHLPCLGGEVRAEAVQTPETATATINVF